MQELAALIAIQIAFTSLALLVCYVGMRGLRQLGRREAPSVMHAMIDH